MDFNEINLIDLSQQAQKLLITYLPKVFLATLVLILGLLIVSRLNKVLSSILEKKSIDPSLTGFLLSLLSWLLKVLLFISVASMLGVATTSFVALLGAAGLAVGLALQGSLANFAGGVLILVLKPFKTGDHIIAQGEEGTVQKIDVFATIILKFDNQRVILPNGALASGKIVNISAEKMRRVDLSIGIGYNDKISQAIQVLEDMCLSHPKVLKTPAPFVGVTGYGDSAINLTIRSWCKNADYKDVFFELNKTIKVALDEAKISIPFPQRDVHIFKEQ